MDDSLELESGVNLKTVIESLDKNLETWIERYRGEKNGPSYPEMSVQKWAIDQVLHPSKLSEYVLGDNLSSEGRRISEAIIQFINSKYPQALKWWAKDNLQLSQMGILDDRTKRLVEEALKLYPDLKKE